MKKPLSAVTWWTKSLEVSWSYRDLKGGQKGCINLTACKSAPGTPAVPLALVLKDLSPCYFQLFFSPVLISLPAHSHSFQKMFFELLTTEAFY